jgi:hypothetical protein
MLSRLSSRLLGQSSVTVSRHATAAATAPLLRRHFGVYKEGEIPVIDMGRYFEGTPIEKKQVSL